MQQSSCFIYTSIARVALLQYFDHQSVFYLAMKSGQPFPYKPYTAYVPQVLIRIDPDGSVNLNRYSLQRKYIRQTHAVGPTPFAV